MNDNEKLAEEIPSVEAGFDALDALLERMEGDDLPLEESFALFEQGMRLLADTHERLSAMEAKVEQLTADGSVSEFLPDDV